MPNIKLTAQPSDEEKLQHQIPAFVDNHASKHRHNRQSEVLHRLADAISGAELILWDNECDEWPQAARQHRVRDTHDARADVGIDKGKGEQCVCTDRDDR